MALPNVNELPSYSCTVPSTKKTIHFRPFLVREQKVLMIAYESSDYASIIKATQDTIQACVEDDLDVANLPTYDIDYIFTQIRSKSVGESSDITISCSKCGEDVPHSIKLDEIEVEGESQNGHMYELNNKFTLRLKHSSYQDLLNNQMLKDAKTATEILFLSLIGCLDAIITEDEQILFKDESEEDTIKFIESLTGDQFNYLQEYVNNQPRLRHTCEYECECGNKDSLTLEGLNDFFS